MHGSVVKSEDNLKMNWDSYKTGTLKQYKWGRICGIFLEVDGLMKLISHISLLWKSKVIWKSSTFLMILHTQRDCYLMDILLY